MGGSIVFFAVGLCSCSW